MRGLIHYVRHRAPVWLVVLGSLAAVAAENAPRKQQNAFLLIPLAFAFVVVRAGVVALAGVCILSAPVAVRDAGRLVDTRPWRSVGVGLLSIAIVVFAMIGADVFPKELADFVRVLLLVALACVACFGLAACLLALGQRLLANTVSPRLESGFWCLLSGGTLIALAGLVPVLGQILDAVLILLAVGAGTAMLRFPRLSARRRAESSISQES